MVSISELMVQWETRTGLAQFNNQFGGGLLLQEAFLVMPLAWLLWTGCVPSQFLCWNPNPNVMALEKWGLWEGTES
jgi:hypothetical protein